MDSDTKAVDSMANLVVSNERIASWLHAWGTQSTFTFFMGIFAIKYSIPIVPVDHRLDKKGLALGAQGTNIEHRE